MGKSIAPITGWGDKGARRPYQARIRAHTIILIINLYYVDMHQEHTIMNIT